MSKLKQQCKYALSTALTVMMVLSMLMGVFSLSASADEDNTFPIILNKPVMVYGDYYGSNMYTQNELSTISIRFDDSMSNCKINDISTVSFTFTDEESGKRVVNVASWYVADRFGVLLVNTPGIKSSYSTGTRKQYLEFMESLGRSSMYLSVTYNNGYSNNIDIGIIDEKLVVSTRSTAWETAGSILVRLAHSKEIENQDFYELDNAIVSVQNVNEDTTNKYYVDINSENEVKIPMNDMTDRVELVQTRIGNTVVYNSYGSVDFGSNIPAISNGEADFGTVYYMPNGAYASNEDPYELVNYLFQNEIYYPMGELDGQPMNLDKMYQVDVFDFESLYKEKFGDLVDRGYFYSDYFTGIDDSVSNEEISKYAYKLMQRMYQNSNYSLYSPYKFDEMTQKPISSFYSGGYSYKYQTIESTFFSPSPFVITFDAETDRETSITFLNNLKAYVENNTGSALYRYLTNSRYHGRYNDDYGYNNRRDNSLGGYQRSFNIFVGSGNYYELITDNSNYQSYYINQINSIVSNLNSGSYPCITGILFTPADFNQKKGLCIPDNTAFQAYEQLIQIANDSGIKIDVQKSFMPRQDYQNCTKVSFKDVFESLGIEIARGKEQRVRPSYSYYYTRYYNLPTEDDYFGYSSSNNGNNNNYVYSQWDYNDPEKKHTLHGDYELVEWGDFVFNTKDSTAPIITDTYYDTLYDEPEVDEENTDEEVTNDNINTRQKGVKFNIDGIRSSIRKGVSYNVVNQVQMGLLPQNKTSWNTGRLSDVSSCGEWLGYGFTDDTGKQKMFVKGNVYYLNGEFVTHSNTVATYAQPFVGFNIDKEGHVNTKQVRDSYSSDYIQGVNNAQDYTVRNTEYKWGEMVFVSKPDPVQEIEYNPDTNVLKWTKPVDEGFGLTSKGKTAKDDYVKVEEYVVKIVDENGKEVFNKSVPRPSGDKVSFDLNTAGLKNENYTVYVTAKNVIGESEPMSKDFVMYVPEIELTMTPDQPVHEAEDTVVFTETIKNTGRVPLTNIIVYQSALGTYEPQEGMTTKGTKASIHDLDIGQSFTIVYNVPASAAVNNVVTNTMQVTNTQKANETASASVVILNPNLSLEVNADKSEYNEDETVVFTAVVTNTGNEKFENITITPDVSGGVFKDLDENNLSVSEDGTAVVLKSLAPSESTEFTYEIPAESVTTDKRGNAAVTFNAAAEDTTAAAISEIRVIKPGLSIKASVEESEYSVDQDIVYTVVVKNTGNNPFENVIITSNIKGEFTENESGTITDKGDFVITELAAGKSVSLVYTVKAENTTYGKLTNTFTASAGDRKEKDSVDTAIVRYGIDVMKLVDTNTHYTGESVQFRTIVTNTGNAELKNVIVTEDKDGTFNLSTGAVIRTDNAIMISSIKPSESYTYDYYIAAVEDKLEDGMLSSTSTVEAKNLEKASDTNSVKICKPSITLTKTVEDKEYVIGDTIVWKDTITNNGECDLTNVVLSENLEGTFNTKYETTASTVTIPTLAAGQSETIEFSTVIKSAYLSDHEYKNSTNVTADQNVSAEANASVKVTGPAVTVQKTADQISFRLGERVVFTEVITNAGDQNLTNVKVEENIEGQFRRIDDSYTAEGKVLTIPEIAVGESVTVQYALERSLIDESAVTSTVTVTCDQKATDSSSMTVYLETEPNTDTNTDSTVDTAKDTNTDSTVDSAKDTNKDSSDDSAKDTNKDSSDDSAKDTSKDSSDDSAKDTSKDSSDDSAKDTSKDTSDDSAKDTSKDSSNDSAKDTSKDSSDDSAKDTNKDSSDDSANDTNKDSTDSNTDTSSEKTESEDQPVKLMMGDVDLDGKVTTKDALIVQRYAIGLDKFIDLQLLLGDVSGDKKVTAADGMMILRWTIKLHTKSTTGELIEISKDLLSFVKQ